MARSRRKAYVVLGLSACIALVLLTNQGILNGEPLVRTVFHIKAAYIRLAQPPTALLAKDSATPQSPSLPKGLAYHGVSPAQLPADGVTSFAATQVLRAATAVKGGSLQTSRDPASVASAEPFTSAPPAAARYFSTGAPAVSAAGPKIDTDSQPTMNLTVLDDKIFLVGAYSDHRKSPPEIKVIVYASKSFRMQLFCVVNRRQYEARLSWINFPNGNAAIWRAGYVECSVPGLTTEPGLTVELTNAEGTARASLPLGQPSVRNNSSAAKRPTFGLCVKSGYGAPSSERFVEWMELNLLLGIERVVLYDQSLRGPVLKAMRHYVDSGRLVVVKDNFKWQLERSQPTFISLFNDFDATRASGDEPFAQMELLSIQDCFHRYRGDYDYIVVADIDEVIVPASGGTLHDLLAAMLRLNPFATSFAHRAAAYLPEFVAPTVGWTATTSSSQSVTSGGLSPTYMLTHTRRTEINWDGSKAIHSTADTDSLNWHRRIWPESNIAYVPPQEAWLHHYRGSCKGASCDARTKVIDDGSALLGRFAHDLMLRVHAVTSELNLKKRR